jgi:NRPS condensation-like uncharacterized protein
VQSNLQHKGVEIEDIYPATPLQSALIAQTIKDSKMYVAQLKWEITGLLNIERFEDALQQVMDAHTILRTRFVSTPDGVYHVLQKKVVGRITIVEDFESYCEDLVCKGFTTEDPLWFSVCVSSQTELVHQAAFTIHHALYDGWCLETLVQQLFAAYEGEVPKKSIPFKNVVACIESQNKDELRNFWKEYLNEVEFGAKIQTPVPEVQDQMEVQPVGLLLSIAMNQLNQVSREQNLTIAVLTKAAWALTLGMYQQMDDVIFGNVMSGRDIPLEGIER